MPLLTGNPLKPSLSKKVPVTFLSRSASNLRENDALLDKKVTGTFWDFGTFVKEFCSVAIPEFDVRHQILEKV